MPEWLTELKWHWWVSIVMFLYLSVFTRWAIEIIKELLRDE